MKTEDFICGFVHHETRRLAEQGIELRMLRGMPCVEIELFSPVWKLSVRYKESRYYIEATPKDKFNALVVAHHFALAELKDAISKAKALDDNDTLMQGFYENMKSERKNALLHKSATTKSKPYNY